MKRQKQLLICILLVIFCSCDKDSDLEDINKETYNENLVLNGDFEIFANYTVADWDLKGTIITPTNIKSHSGNLSIKIETNERYATKQDFSQYIPYSKFVKGETYILSAWIYPEYLNSVSEFDLVLDCKYRPKKISVNEIENNWQHYSIEFVHELDYYYEIRFYPKSYPLDNDIDYKYLVWIDNVSIRKKESDN